MACDARRTDLRSTIYRQVINLMALTFEPLIRCVVARGHVVTNDLNGIEQATVWRLGGISSWPHDFEI